MGAHSIRQYERFTKVLGETETNTLRIDVNELKVEVHQLKVEVHELKTDVKILKLDVINLKSDVEVQEQLNELKQYILLSQIEQMKWTAAVWFATVLLILGAFLKSNL